MKTNYLKDLDFPKLLRIRSLLYEAAAYLTPELFAPEFGDSFIEQYDYLIGIVEKQCELKTSVKSK